MTSPEPNTKKSFERLLTGREPTPYREIVARADAPPSTARRHRRARLAIGLLATAIVGVVGVIFAVSRNSGTAPVDAQAPLPIATTQRTALPAAAIECEGEVLDSTPPALPPPDISSASEQMVHDHFGDRFNSLWTGKNHHMDVSATDITPADRQWASQVPITDGTLKLVQVPYSLAQLKTFAARLQQDIPVFHLPARHQPGPPRPLILGANTTTITIPDSIWPKGLYDAGVNLKLDGSPQQYVNAVVINVRHCSPELIAQAVRIASRHHVPADALRLFQTG